MDEHSERTLDVPPADEPAKPDAGVPGFGGWTVEDIQRQADAIWAQAQGQLAEVRLNARHTAPAAAQASAGPAPDPAGPPPADGETAGPDAPRPDPVGPDTVGPGLLAAGAQSLFGEMVASQHQASRASTADLLQRVFSIYGLTLPAASPSGGDASAGQAPPRRASVPETAQKES